MKVTFFKKTAKWYRRMRISSSPQMNLVWGFFLYTVIGVLLLSLPFLHKQEVSFLDNLFISTSAISTTGLVTVGVYDSYNIFGQIVVMLLFQIGGIGYMSLTTYYLLLTTNRITKWHTQLVGTAFTLPNTIRLDDFIKSVIVFTIVMEVLGAIAFTIAFLNEGMGLGESIWFGIFHSISAFCTAGFALFGDGFEGFSDNVFVNIIISVLAISGSLGFIVITDVWYRIKGRTENLSFTTKIVLVGFVLLLAWGTTMLMLTESSIKAAEGSTFMVAFFQSMTAMTTVGFNTVPIGDFALPMLLLTTFLMYIGASPSGTAGGMKITTLTAMIAVLKSRVFGQKKITFLGRAIPFERLYVATSTFMLYTILIFFFSFLLSFSEDFAFERILFEVASALGTVGLSTGITGDLSAAGKLIIIFVMFIGRVGVLTFGFALLARKEEGVEVIEKEDLAV